jgi:hypothetical protein
VLNTEDVGHYGELTLKPLGGSRRISIGRIAFYLLGLGSVGFLWHQLGSSQIQVSPELLGGIGVAFLLVAAMVPAVHFLRHRLRWSSSSGVDAGRTRLGHLKRAMDRQRIDLEAA